MGKQDITPIEIDRLIKIKEELELIDICELCNIPTHLCDVNCPQYRYRVSLRA